MKVKILVGYHKKSLLIKNEIFVPIHLGRDLYEAKKANQDKAWLYENLIGDNTGENISSKNSDYCELTGIYWAWKNYSKLNNPDFIGFMHYRRLLSFNGWSMPKHRNNPIIVNVKAYLKKNNKFNIYQTLSNGKIFTRLPLDFFETEGRESCRARGFDYLKIKYPQIYQIYLKQKQNNCLYASNIFVMQREDFFEYCEIIFDVLFNYDSQGYSREKGYLAEFITSAYIEYLAQKYGKVSLLPIVTPHENPTLRFLQLSIYKVLIFLSFGRFKQNLKKKRETLKRIFN